MPVTLSARGQLGNLSPHRPGRRRPHVTAQGPPPARPHPAGDGEQIAAQLAKTGGTVYAVQDLQVDWGRGSPSPCRR